jgi:hypothetical protein
MIRTDNVAERYEANPKCTHNKRHPCEECPHFYYNIEHGRDVCHNNAD